MALVHLAPLLPHSKTSSPTPNTTLSQGGSGGGSSGVRPSYPSSHAHNNSKKAIYSYYRKQKFLIHLLIVLVATFCCLCSTGAASTVPIASSDGEYAKTLQTSKTYRAGASLTNLRAKRQLSTQKQSPASSSSREAVKPQSKSSAISPPSSYVLFRRWIAVGSSPTYHEITNSKRSEVVTLVVAGQQQPQKLPIKLKCSAQLHPQFTSNPPLTITVNWRRKRRRSNDSEETQEEQAIDDLATSSGHEAILEINDTHLKDEDFKCVANIVIGHNVSSANFDAIQRRRVLSRSIKVRYLHHTNVLISPLRQTIEEGMPARIKCSYSVSSSIYFFYANKHTATANVAVVWRRNGQVVQQHDGSSKGQDGIRIFTTSDQSVLHIGSVTHSDHQLNEYQCTVTVNGLLSVAAESVSSSISTLLVVAANSSIEHEPLDTNSQHLLQLTNSVNVRRNSEAILECLLPRSVHINWFSILKEKGHSSIVTRSLLSNDSALIFDPKQYAEAMEPIEFQCVIKEESGVIFTYKFMVSIKEDSYFDYEEDSFTEVSKHQGQIAKLICETYPKPEKSRKWPPGTKMAEFSNRFRGPS
uniref:Ig-like domain-containing protein n=1 Tax=Ditylenchus dipsaci TaxID=166011 RepID=A0A915DF01_9BILA